jgi:predicted transcriptional regulator
MSPAQCRAARALIELSQAELAAVTVVPATVIADFETGAWIRPADLKALQRALERAGVEFINGGDQSGVRLRKGSERPRSP